MKGEKTILVKAHSKSDSLRTTVPSSVVNQLGLKEGHVLIWSFKARKSEIIVCVKKEK